MKLSKRLSVDSSVVRYTVFFTVLFALAAHAFCLFNLTYTSGSVMLSVSDGRRAQIAGGQYLLPFYWLIRGSISAPLWVGLLSALYLTAANVAIAGLLGLRSPLSLFALCGTMTANAAVTTVFAGALNTADAVFLSMLLVSLAVACCIRLRWGAFAGAALLAAALALDAAVLPFFAALALLALLSHWLDEQDAREWRHALLALLGALGLGLALYAAGDFVMLRRSGIQQAASWRIADTPLAPIQALLAPLIAYPHLSIALRVLLALLAAAALLGLWKARGARHAAIPALLTLALPLAAGLPLFSGQPVGQILPAYCLLDLIPLLFIFRLSSRRVQRFAASAFGVLFLGSIVFANQVYLKKNLEFESTLSLTSRIIQRAEETEGYQPGVTPVAIIGTPENSIFAVERKGFEHLAALDAAKGHYAIATDEDMIWYCWDVLGYPFNFVSAFELEQLKADQAVMAMPAFPAEGCCAFVGETLVVKVSPAY